LAGDPLGAGAQGPGRDAHRIFALPLDQAGAAAAVAADLGDLARAAAGQALALGGEEPGALARVPLPFAALAGGEARGPPLRAGTAALAAVLGPVEADGLLAAQRRLGEVELERVAQVLPRGALAAEAEQVAEHGVEEVGHLGDVGVDTEGEIDGA